METSPNITKCTKDVVQSECPIPEEAELADALGNTDPNANWGAEPNFNLNLTLTSPSNPRPATETSKLHGVTKKDHGNKGGWARGAVTTETGKSASALTTCVMSPRERDDPSRPKSKISALSRSPTAEALVNSKEEQRLKLPNPKRAPSLSPTSHAHSSMAASPKPQVTISSPRTTERVQSVSNPKPHIALTTKTTIKITINPKGHSHHDQKGDLNVTNQTPTITAKPQKPDPASTRHDLGTHSSEMPPVGPKSPNQRAATALHSTKTRQPSSLNAKPSTQRKASGTRNSSASGSKENLDGKDLSLSSGSKTTYKSSSISKAKTKDSLDSKTCPNSRTAMGSKDSLSSKSGSASKTSSRDSLDSKTGSNSKASPNSKSGMGSRDSLDSKNATEIKASKTNPDSKTVVGSKSGVGSKDNLDPKTQSSDSKTSSNLRTSPSFKHGSQLNPSSNSDVFSRSKPGPTRSSSSKPSLVASSSKMDLVGPDSLLSSGTCLQGSKDNNLKAAASGSSSDSSKPGPVRFSSKPALADLSPSSVLSPSPSPTSSSPGSDPGKALGSSPAEPNRDIQRSPGSGPGSGVILGLLDPLATSSPKTRSTVALTMMKGSTSAPAAVALNTSRTSVNVSLTRGLTFDAAVDGEHLKLPETKVRAAGEPAVSQEALQGADVTDNTARLPGDRKIPGTRLSKPSQLGDGNAIAVGSNIPSPRANGVERKKEDKKKERGKPKHGPGSSSSPLPSSSSQLSTHPASSKSVRETATMMSPSESLHLQEGERREVGVQVEVVECSNCHSGASSSPIGSPSCECGSLNSPTVPSLCCTPAGHPPYQHVCKIDIELCSQLALPSVGAERASSLAAGLRTYSFQQRPPRIPELQLGQNQDVSSESIWEDGGQEDVAREETGKPQEVTWDQQGRTWEVYGASVDLESLGTAIQSHLESKIREQEKQIRTLRKSTCSDVSLAGYKRKKRRGGILGCCVRTPNVTD